MTRGTHTQPDRPGWRRVNRKEPPAVANRPWRGDSPALPQGFAPVAVSVYRRGRTLIITGNVDANKDPESQIHNCDALGCGWEHVLAMVQLTPEQEKQFEVLCPRP